MLVTAENERILLHKINKVMNEMQSWFNMNILVMNTEKTAIMSFHTRQIIILITNINQI
jgi:hypothetical protein